MTKIPSYPKIYALGHAALRQQGKSIFKGKIHVQEKVDGSNFSFVKIADQLHFRSKSVQINPFDPQKMFVPGMLALEKVKDKIKPNHIYRCEYLSQPKHNSLTYNRVPRHHVAVFDIQPWSDPSIEIDAPIETYLDRSSIFDICGDTFEVIPEYILENYSHDNLIQLLDRESFLGGPKIEGIVIKNYEQFTPDGKVMMGKYVSEAFKEVHEKNWKQSNPSQTQFVDKLIMKYGTDARIHKSIIHAKEEGKLHSTPRDIGLLVGKVKHDILEEEGESIKEELFNHFIDKILRGCVRNVPYYYKEYLAKEEDNGECK